MGDNRAGKRRSDSREAICLAAEALLVEDPEATFTEIAAKAGISSATIYRHFPDRSALMLALMGRLLSRLEKTPPHRDRAPGGFRDLLIAMARELARFRGLTTAARSGEIRTDRLLELRQRTIDLFRAPLDEARRSGEVRADFELVDVLALISMIEGAVAAPAQPLEREQAAKFAVDTLMVGLLPRD